MKYRQFCLRILRKMLKQSEQDIFVIQVANIINFCKVIQKFSTFSVLKFMLRSGDLKIKIQLYIDRQKMEGNLSKNRIRHTMDYQIAKQFPSKPIKRINNPKVPPQKKKTMDRCLQKLASKPHDKEKQKTTESKQTDSELQEVSRLLLESREEKEDSPYNSYFTGTSSMHQRQKQRRKLVRKQLSQRGRSADSPRSDSLMKQTPNTKRFHESLRQYINENNKLKEQNKRLSERVEELAKQKKQLMKKMIASGSELHLSHYKLYDNSGSVQKVWGSREHSMEHQNEFLVAEIQKMKEKLMMKEKKQAQNLQQRVQLKQTVQKLKIETQQLKARSRELPRNQLEQRSHAGSISTNSCSDCQRNSAKVVELTNIISGKMETILSKQNTISSLYRRIQGLEGKIKSLQVQKQPFGKYLSLVDSGNQSLIKSKSQQLNNKYFRFAM